MSDELTSWIYNHCVSSTHAILDVSQFGLELLRGFSGWKKGFCSMSFSTFSMSFSTFSMSFSTFWLIDDFLKNSLALILRQYKLTPVGAKVSVWAAKDDAIFTFSAMGMSKTSEAHKPKTPCLNNLLNIFSFNYWNWVYNFELSFDSSFTSL